MTSEEIEASVPALNGRSELPASCPEAVGDRIIVLRDETITEVGSIALSSGAQEDNLRGLVCSVGPGRTLEATPAVLQAQSPLGPEVQVIQARNAISLKVGQRVWFAAYSASSEIEWDGLAFLALTEEDILAREPERT